MWAKANHGPDATFKLAAFASANQFLHQDAPTVPACLVLDIRMPGLSGLDLQKELATASRRIPIIFLTGHANIPMTVRAMKAGASEFLTKPFSADELLTAIHQALARVQKVPFFCRPLWCALAG